MYLRYRQGRRVVTLMKQGEGFRIQLERSGELVTNDWEHDEALARRRFRQLCDIAADRYHEENNA